MIGEGSQCWPVTSIYMRTHVHLHIHKPSYTSLFLTSAGQQCIAASVICCVASLNLWKKRNKSSYTSALIPTLIGVAGYFIHLQMSAHVCVGTHIWQRLQKDACCLPLSLFALISWDRVCYWNSSSLFQLGSLANSLARLLQAAFQCCSFAHIGCVLLFSVDAENLNSGLQVWTTSVLSHWVAFAAPFFFCVCVYL